MTVINELEAAKQGIIKDEGFWSADAPAQVDKVKESIKNKGGKFKVKNNVNVENVKGSKNYHADGKEYTIDVGRLTKNVDAFIELWSVPTLEGHDVDIWLVG